MIENDKYYRNKRLHGKTFANAFIYIDEKCNMFCKHCYLGERLSNPKKMSRQQIVDFLMFFKVHLTKKCTIIGGEPTLSDDLFFTIKKINEFGMDCILDTNGWFNQSLYDHISHTELEYLSFSLDSASAEYHDSQRRKGSFQKAVANIKYAIKKGFCVRIIPTITKRNQHCANDILKLGEQLGVSSVNFHSVTRAGNAKQRSEDICLEPEEWIKFYADLETHKNKYSFNIWYPPTYAYKNDLIKFNEKGYKGCVGRTIDRISVFPNNTCYICSLFFDEDKEHHGKSNGYFGKFENRKFLLNFDDNNEMNHFINTISKCYSCDYVSICYRGCPFEQSIDNESFCDEHKIFPMCRLWKTQV
ncbi:MAG TPA: radical SAM protein [Victivallales bacterium]|nr:radical SAM protein [Victivallales bacterium]